MPELPEVEIIKLGLQKKIVGLKIQKVQVLSPKSFIGNPNLAEGQKVLRIWRRAKMLGIDLVGDGSLATGHSLLARSQKLKANSKQQITLLFHLKMSGQLIYISGEKRKAKSEKRFIGGHPTEDMLGKMPNTHTRVIFTLKENSRLPTLATSHLYFNDQRKFGWVKVTRSVILSERSESKDLKNLGPEPLEKGFTWQILKSNLLHHKSQPVKVAIMDQSVVSGIGNIYSNEACFLAKIDPKTKVSALTDKQFQALYEGIIKSLRAGIKYGGSTRVHFTDPEGRKGYFLDYAYVYWRDKLPCKICKTTIGKISLGGRGTYFCSACQR